MIGRLLNRTFSLCWICFSNCFHGFKFSSANIQNFLCCLFYSLRSFIFCFRKIGSHVFYCFIMIEYRFNINICFPCLYPSLKKLPIKQAFVVFWGISENMNHLTWMDRALSYSLSVTLRSARISGTFSKSSFVGFKIFRFLGSRILSMYSFTFDSILSRSIRKLFLVSSDKSLDSSNNCVFCKKFSKMVPALSTFIFAARPWMWMHLVYCG